MMKSLISVTKLKGCKLLVNCNLDNQNKNCGASARDQKLLVNVSTKDHVNAYVLFANANACFSIGLFNLDSPYIEHGNPHFHT